MCNKTVVENVIKDLRSQKCDLFAERASVNDVIDAVDMFMPNNDARASAMTLVMMMFNTTLEAAAKHFERELNLENR